MARHVQRGDANAGVAQCCHELAARTLVGQQRLEIEMRGRRVAAGPQLEVVNVTRGAPRDDLAQVHVRETIGEQSDPHASTKPSSNLPPSAWAPPLPTTATNWSVPNTSWRLIPAGRWPVKIGFMSGYPPITHRGSPSYPSPWFHARADAADHVRPHGLAAELTRRPRHDYSAGTFQQDGCGLGS